MRKQITLFFVLIPILISCRGNLPTACDDCGFQCLTNGEKNVVTNNCFLFDDCGFNYYLNSRIDITESNGFSDGNKKVFKLTTSNDAVEGIRLNLKNTLVFELDDEIRRFEYNGQDFNSLKVQFKRESGSNINGFDEVKIGCIAGEQQANGVWFVYGKVNVPNVDTDESVKFEARFETE